MSRQDGLAVKLTIQDNQQNLLLPNLDDVKRLFPGMYRYKINENSKTVCMTILLFPDRSPWLFNPFIAFDFFSTMYLKWTEYCEMKKQKGNMELIFDDDYQKYLKAEIFLGVAYPIVDQTENSNGEVLKKVQDCELIHSSSLELEDNYGAEMYLKPLARWKEMGLFWLRVQGEPNNFPPSHLSLGFWLPALSSLGRVSNLYQYLGSQIKHILEILHIRMDPVKIESIIWPFYAAFDFSRHFPPFLVESNPNTLYDIDFSALPMSLNDESKELENLISSSSSTTSEPNTGDQQQELLERMKKKYAREIENLNFCFALDSDGTVTEIEIRRMPLARISSDIFHFTQLKFIRLEDNGLDSLPLQMTRFQNLERLELEKNNFSEIPAILAELPKLKCLAVSENRVPINFSKSQLKLYQLESLHLFDVKLECTENLWQMIPNLRILKLSLINTTFTCVGIELIKNLIELSLNCCKLKEFPIEICHLTQLTYLSLVGNEFENLPDAFGSLFLLNSLNISFNSFSICPKIITLLKNLKDLNIEHNHLTIFPDLLASLPKLEVLNLAKNPIEEISNASFQMFPHCKINICRTPFAESKNIRGIWKNGVLD